MLHICLFRLKLMYAGVPVRILVALITVIISILLYGLYQGAGEASKLKVGYYFPENDQLTETITKSLEKSEILLPRPYNLNEGMKAVKESRIEAFFVFSENLASRIDKNDFEELVDVYFLEENRMPYLLTDILGAELMGEIAVSSALGYFEGALKASGNDAFEDPSYMKGLHDKGLIDSQKETDNFFVRQTYLNEKNIQVEDVVLSNEILYKQIIYGVVYIFAVFFWMFLGVSIVSDREMGLGKRWYTTGMSDRQVFLGEVLSIWIGGLPLTLAVTSVETLLDGHLRYYLVANLLFALAYSSFIHFVTNVIDKVTVYVLAMTAMILIGGIVSGSFFALDTERSFVMLMTWMTPTYHLLTALLNVEALNLTSPSFVYVQHMALYTFVMMTVSYMIRKIRSRILKGLSL